MNFLSHSGMFRHFLSQIVISAILLTSLTAAVTAQKTDDFGDSKIGFDTEQSELTTCSGDTIKLGGDSPASGSFGNIRTFNSNGAVSVKASGFSRRRSDGLWETGYLGAYGSGLGVTDRGEGDGSNDTHKVDNIGDRVNYVLFEFNYDVVVDSAFLDSLGANNAADSDITVWVGNGTNPYNNHLTLSDALLSSFGPSEDNNTDSTSPRLANINSGQKVGNVLVIAASTSDTTPEDAFKISDLEFKCASSNRATVTIIKEVATLNGTNSSPQVFNFTSSRFGSPSTFGLTDQNVTGPDRRINANITAFGSANSILVTLSQTAGWTLADIRCVETGGTMNTVVEFGNMRARIIPEAGESIVCTFRCTQLIPSAAMADISGRAITADGAGIRNVMLTLTKVDTGEVWTTRTNSFGHYRFPGNEVGSSYMITTSHKQYVFRDSPRFVNLLDELSGLDFVESN